MKIDVTNQNYYEYNDAVLKRRTRNRLRQLHRLGLEELGNCQFGIKGVASGLYIEMVWRYSHEQWNDYLEWMLSVIRNKKDDYFLQFIADPEEDLSDLDRMCYLETNSIAQL